MSGESLFSNMPSSDQFDDDKVLQEIEEDIEIEDDDDSMLDQDDEQGDEQEDEIDIEFDEDDDEEEYEEIPETEEDILEDTEGLEDEIIDFGDSETNKESDHDSDESEESDESDEDSLGADDLGVDINLEESGLTDGEEYAVVSRNDNSFISASGDIVVQDKEDNGKNFKLVYIPIENITVVKRIRANRNVESLVQSIRSTGLLKPIVVAPLATDGLYVLIDGYRRILACAKVGLKAMPCIINTRINTPDIPILEALYNHAKSYTIKEMIDYIDYLEKEKGIMSASMIEYLLQMDNGDYTKLKDVLNDNDDDIVSALMNGQMTIAQAFKKLEQRRKKESKEEQELKKTEQVYGDAEESGVNQIAGSGEEGTDTALTDEEIASLAISADEINDVDNMSLDDMVAEGKSMDGFEDHKQTPGEREIIDPAIRKAVMSRDDNTCQCCKRGGPDYVDILDLHHIVEVYLGGVDSVDNSIALCLNCHKQVHLYAFNKLHIPKTKTPEELEIEVKTKIAEQNAKNEQEGLAVMTAEEEQEFKEGYIAVYREEQNKYKRIVKLGNVIRKGLQMKGMKLEQAKKDHPIDKIGRQMPGTKNVIA